VEAALNSITHFACFVEPCAANSTKGNTLKAELEVVIPAIIGNEKEFPWLLHSALRRGSLLAVIARADGHMKAGVPFAKDTLESRYERPSLKSSLRRRMCSRSMHVGFENTV